MKKIKFAGLLLGSALLAFPAFSPAMAQTTQPLSYTQPLSPQAQREVQRHLKDLGIYGGAVDGIWGRDSQEALERFQQSRGLQVTNHLNQATLATMGIKPVDLLTLGDGSAAAAGPEVTGRDMTTEAVRTIQGRLRQLGLYAGETDGIWGDSTQAALERFQRDRGLQATGRINPNTLTTMGLEPNVLMAQTR